MILYCAVVLVILANDNEAKRGTIVGSEKNPTPSFIDTGELARLIHNINKDDYANNFENVKFEDKHIGGKLYGKQQALDLDYFDIRADEKTPASAVIKLIQKNYLANQAHARDEDYTVRVHVIRNPHVLEQYRKNLRKKLQSTSSSSDDDSSDYDMGIERLKRRSAVFRLAAQLDGIDTHQNPQFALRNGEDEDFNYHTKSRENNDKIIHFEGSDDHIKGKKMVLKFKDSEHKDYDDKKEFSDANKSQRDNHNELQSKKDDWDVIIKNDWDKSDKKKRNSRYNDDRKKDDKDNDGYKKNNKYNDDYKNNDKYNDDYKKSDKLNDDYKHNDNYNDDYKKEDKYKDDSVKIVNYNDYDKKWTDKDTKKRSKTEKKQDDWDKTSNYKTTKKDNGWDTWKSQSEKNRDKDDNWDNTRVVASYESKPKNYWNEKEEGKQDKTFKISTYKSKNVWDRGGGSGNNKPFVAKTTNHYNPRPRMHKNTENVAFKPFGRTSIPFIGKKGIYEE